jgi:hypothetical protein
MPEHESTPSPDDGCSTADLPFREGVPHNIGTDCRVSISRSDRYIEAVSLFWLNYRHPDGRFAVVAVVEAMALIQARMKAAVTGLDQGLDFAVGHELDEQSARQIPADMIGRLLDDGDLRRLQRIITRKKPTAPSVRLRSSAKKSVSMP